jgi:glycosyltransferase involved in cell wall biosynthesis
MRLLYVCNDFGIRPDGTKGASVHVRAITRALHDLGHEVQLLNPYGDAGSDHPARALLQQSNAPIKHAVKPLKRWLVANDLDDSVARDLRPLTWGPWVAERATEALADQPPDAIIERLSLFSGVGLELAKQFDCPLIIEVNAILSEEAREHRTLALGELAEAIERKALGEADAVVAVSQSLCDRLAKDFCDPQRVVYAPNGADPNHYDTNAWRDATRQDLGIDDGFVVGFIGSLKPWHGIEVLLEAFTKLQQQRPEARLLVVGDGPCAKDVRALAKRDDLAGKIILTGAVDSEKVAQYLTAMDLAVAPYRDHHGCYFSPMKVFESMAAGVCSVASSAGQLPELITDGEDGRLVPPGDVDALARAMTELAGDADLRGRLGDAGRATIRSRYTWRHTAENVLDTIEKARAARAVSSLTAEGSL